MKNISYVILFCLALCFFAPSPALGQTSSQNVAAIDDASIQRTLLNEVRQLRLTLQMSNLLTYRTQILVERLRVQQGVVDRLAQELAQLQQEAPEENLFDPQSPDIAREQENLINREPDVARRNEMEASFKLIRRQLTRQEQLRREREATLTMRLQAEQGKLGELNDRLDALEREMETPPK